MPAHDSIASQAHPRKRTPWQGYGPLAAAWLLLLAAGALAGWFVQTSDPAERPTRTATLYSGAVPSPPEPAQPEVAAVEIDPRSRQLATRDVLAAAPADDRVDAIDPLASMTDAQPAGEDMLSPAVPAIPVAIDRAEDTRLETAAAAAANQLAALTDAPAADAPKAELSQAESPQAESPETEAVDAGPLPPPIPRSIATTASGWPAASSAARYSVQVGAFRMRENAVERAARLSDAGYDVRIVHAFATHSRLYMVRLGAFDARPAAMAYARQLASDVGVETWPVRN
jgi:cell division protein FtsN